MIRMYMSRNPKDNICIYIERSYIKQHFQELQYRNCKSEALYIESQSALRLR